MNLDQFPPKGKRCRILYVHHGLGIAGASIYLENIVRTLDQSQFDPVVLMRNSPAISLFEGISAEIIPVQRIPNFAHTTAEGYAFFDPRFLAQWLSGVTAQKKWREVFASLNPDIVHLNSVTLAHLCKPAFDAGAKVVISVQETVLPGMLGVRKRWLSRYLSHYAHAVLFISRYDKSLLNVCAPAITEVIPNWIDLNVFDRRISGAQIRTELGVSSDQKLILTLGGAAPIKGTLDLLKSTVLLQNRADYVFAVAGVEPPDSNAGSLLWKAKLGYTALRGIEGRARIYDYYLRNKLAGKVHFLGVRRDIPALLAACDVLVFPAKRAHQARPILEAGAMGKPIIATDFECLSEYVQHEETGLLVPPSDPVALSVAIRTLLDTPDMARRLGEANFRVTMREHDGERNAKRVTGVYEQLMHSGGSSGVPEN